MGTYQRSSSRARRKKPRSRARASEELPRKKRKKLEKPAKRKTPKRVRKVARKPTRKKTPTRARARAKPSVRKGIGAKGKPRKRRAPAARKPKKPTRPKIAARATRKRATKTKAKPKARKRAKPKPAARPKAKPRTKAVAKPRRTAKRGRGRGRGPTKAEIAKENLRLRRELAKVKRAEQSTRKAKPKSRAKRGIRKTKNEIARAKIEQVFAIHELPHETPEKALESRKEDWARKKLRFQELLDIAKKSGQLAKHEKVKRRITSEKNRGEQIAVRLERRVTPASVESLLYKIERRAEKLPGTRGKWLAKIVLSSFGERLIGSGNRLLVVKKKDPDAENFYVQTFDSTGAWNTFQGMMLRLSDVLEDYASARRNVVFLHTVKIMNFERRP